MAPITVSRSALVVHYDPAGEFVLCPEGLHRAVCVAVEDLGLVVGFYGEKHKAAIVWQVDGVSQETGLPYEARKSYNLTLHPKATLRRDLESWRGAHLTSADLEAGVNLALLIGQACQITILHVKADDGVTYANVETIVPAPRQAPRVPTPTRPRAVPARRVGGPAVSA